MTTGMDLVVISVCGTVIGTSIMRMSRIIEEGRRENAKHKILEESFAKASAGPNFFTEVLSYMDEQIVKNPKLFDKQTVEESLQRLNLPKTPPNVIPIKAPEIKINFS